MARPVVLVTSSSGRIGKELVARLRTSDKFTIRAAIYSEANEEYLKKLGADEVVKFDLTDKGTWDAALKDVEVIYSASLDPLLEHHLSFSGYLGKLQHQVKHVVRVSCTTCFTW